LRAWQIIALGARLRRSHQHFRRLCMKRYVLAALATTMLFGATGAVRADDALKAAIAAPSRTPDNVKRDVYRHPYETLTFLASSRT
jgi:hypothetical protein